MNRSISAEVYFRSIQSYSGADSGLPLAEASCAAGTAALGGTQLAPLTMLQLARARFAPAAARAAVRPAALRIPAATTRAYHEDLIDHYENPRNVGRLDKKAENVGTGLVGAPACGDVMQLQIQVDDDGTITESKFKTFGCGSAIASSSLATEWLKGKTVTEAQEITNKQIATELKLPPVKLHCRWACAPPRCARCCAPIC